MAERQFGPYRLVKQIAVGGMAEIHLAKTKGIAGFEKYVALKMIHPNFAEDDQFIQMLVDEAKIAVQLNHGNIAQTFDLGRVGETFYITMEYVDGADLYKILRRGSEIDHEMPLDVCAFIGKEIASALDHAHRKKDHTGRPLGIVHRDVSPQNVLVSYSGEVKLVDFGIAKATMKARQTAVGVIKGKYYYMSPEQAWGDQIDYRSDIFSAGIVLYETIVGQMLYLEEDLHKLLDMARKADIKPPSTLRKGIPPQLEKIVMHALQRVPGERYQSAGDLAADLERFLHTYSPVFTAAKVSQMIKKVVGEPEQVPPQADFPDIEVHDGANATFTLDTGDLVHDGKELHDENSVIFRPSELKKPGEPEEITRPEPRKAGAPKVADRRGPANSTRAHADTEPPPIVAGQVRPPPGQGGAKLSSIGRPSGSAPAPAGRQPTPAKPLPSVPRAAPQPRKSPNEETRQLDFAAPGGEDVSGLLMPSGQKVSASTWDATETDPGDELENIGERTMITAPSGMASPMGGFMMDGDEPVDATLVTDMPQAPESDTDDLGMEGDGDEDEDAPTLDGHAAVRGDEEGPTVAREFSSGRSDKPKVVGKKNQPPPAALAAKINAPAVSELRKPRKSQRTPQGGVPAVQQPNVLQQMLSQQASEPMPSPRAQPASQPPPMQPPPNMQPQMQMQQPMQMQPPPQMMQPPQMQQPMPQQPQQFPYATPGQQAPYATDASGLPMAMATVIPGQYPPQQPYGYPPQGYPQQHYQQGYPPQPPQQQYHQGYPQQPQGQPQHQVTPGALYSFQPGQKPMSLTGQMRLFEVDELPSQYKLGAARRRMFTYIVAAVLALSVAAGVTFLIIRSTRETAPETGKVRIESVPAGAQVTWDGTKLTEKTPVTVEGVPIGSRHEVKVELARHKTYVDAEVDVPKTGQEIQVMALLKPITGKLRIISTPDGAEIYINGEPRGRAPKTINDVDMDSAKKIELRLKDYQPYVQDLEWPANGEVAIDAKMKR